MYEQKEKSKVKKSRAASSSVDKRGRGAKQAFSIFDGRIKSRTQNKMLALLSQGTKSKKETRQLLKKSDKNEVAQLVEVGDGFNVTDNSTQANPWIYVSMMELDAPVNVIVGNDGDIPDGYIEYAQFCSVMSVEWLDSGTVLFSDLSGDRKKEIVEIALNNSSNEEQIAWGVTKIGGSEYTGDIEDIGLGKKVLIYGPTHVTAAIRTKSGFEQYEPENGSVNNYTISGFQQVFGELTIVVS